MSKTLAEELDAPKLYQAISTFDIRKLSYLLQNLELRKSLEIVNLYDSKGYTLLHHASYQNSFKISDFLI